MAPRPSPNSPQWLGLTAHQAPKASRPNLARCVNCSIEDSARHHNPLREKTAPQSDLSSTHRRRPRRRRTGYSFTRLATLSTATRRMRTPAAPQFVWPPNSAYGRATAVSLRRQQRRAACRHHTTAHPCNSYLQPSGPLPQSMPSPPQPPPEATPGLTPSRDDPHRVLLSEWRSCHGCEWTRADDLAPTVCRMIDERQRLPAIRQRLHQLDAACSELETKTVGNRARRVVLYQSSSAKSRNPPRAREGWKV